MISLYYQKAQDQEGFEVLVIDFETNKVVWKGVVSELVDNDR